MGKWGKWVMLFVLAMAFAMPAWAVDFKLGGKYEIQGRYYSNEYIKDVPNDLTFPTTDMYLFHELNFYPTVIVNDKIKIVGNLEVFDNKISRDDEVNWNGIYQDYTEIDPTGAITEPGETKSKLNTRNYKPYSQYNTFTVDEFYADVTTGIGKFIAGKTTDFSGLAWFIQIPAIKDWTFGLVWNKKQEWGTTYGTDNVNNTGDSDEFLGLVKLENANTMFNFNLAYKYSGAGSAQTRIWYPYLYFNQKFGDLVKMNLKLAYGTGPFVKMDSPIGSKIGAEEDWKVDNIFGGWLGFGITPGNATIQIDGAYLPGAKKPNLISGYLLDNENLDSWLMNDVNDYYAFQVETYPTIAAVGDPRVDGNFSFSNAILGRLNLGYKFTSKLDGNLNFIYGQRENTKYLENWYFDNYAPSPTEEGKFTAPGLANAVHPSMLEGKIYQIQQPTGVHTDGTPILPIYVGTYTSDVQKDLGWELRGRMNYKWMDNFSIGIDLCYFKPGGFYKKLIENDFREIGSTYYYYKDMNNVGKTLPDAMLTWPGTGNDLKDTYAARWIAKVTF